MQAALAAAIALAAITIATKNNLLEGARFCRAFSFVFERWRQCKFVFLRLEYCLHIALKTKK